MRTRTFSGGGPLDSPVATARCQYEGASLAASANVELDVKERGA
jgi:hypothetical protein